MGQKVSPTGLRVGVIKTWDSRWYAEKQEYVKWLHQDIKIRKALMKELKGASVSKIENSLVLQRAIRSFFSGINTDFATMVKLEKLPLAYGFLATVLRNMLNMFICTHIWVFNNW